MSSHRVTPSRIVDFLDSHWVERAIRVSVVMLLVGMMWLTAVQHRLAQCQIDYAEATATASKARAQAAEEDRAALRAMVGSVLAGNSPIASRNALLAFQDASASADAKRTANPLPAPPSQFCK